MTNFSPRSVRSALAAIALAVALVGCASSEVEPSPTGEGELPASEPIVTGYRLDEGDQIAIQVFDEPDLTMTATVGASGGINYSYLGNIQVAGKTPAELESSLAGLLRNGYLVNPSVNVSVVQFRPFYINGEVNSPGSYPYEPGLTMNKAIALAGGLSDRASLRQMYVVRARDEEQARKKVGGNARINPGDTIIIEEGFF